MGSGICRYRRDSVGVVRVLQGRRSGDQTFPARYRIVACQRTSGRSLHDPRRGAWICFSPVSHLGADYQCGCARRRHPACALVVTAENSLAKSSPYLFRLADVLPTVDKERARVLQSLIERGAPPYTPPCQIVIDGPIGAGRTSMAASIGTEFAFKNHKVRYLSLDALLEFAVNATEACFPDDVGQRRFHIGGGASRRLSSLTALGQCSLSMTLEARQTFPVSRRCSTPTSARSLLYSNNVTQCGS